jgi:hypothetical protein
VDILKQGTDSLNLLEYRLCKPIITAKSSTEEQKTVHTFMINDMKANSIIYRCLSLLVVTNLPTKCDNSAHKTWKCLSTSHGKVDFNAQITLRSHVISLKLMDTSNIDRYLGEFNTSWAIFVTMGITYTDNEGIYQVLMGILDSSSWGRFKQVTLTTTSKSPLRFKQVVSCIKGEGICVGPLSKAFRPGLEYANQAWEIRHHKNNPNCVTCTNQICVARGQRQRAMTSLTVGKGEVAWKGQNQSGW